MVVEVNAVCCLLKEALSRLYGSVLLSFDPSLAFIIFKRLSQGGPQRSMSQHFNMIVSPWLQRRINSCFFYSFSGVSSACAYFLVLANLHLQLENDCS